MNTDKDFNGYCIRCGGFGHRSSSCTRWTGIRLAHPE